MEIAENIDILEYEWLGEEDGSVMMAAEDSWRGLAVELNELHRLVEGETNIFSALGEQSEDFDNLLNAARKAVEHGHRVYILPNPKGIRTADFIFERKGVYKMYDLKTISGKTSLENRLKESIGQTNHVLVNVCSTYNARLMAIQIKNYFKVNPDALEVLVYKGKKAISVTRRFVENPLFLILFRRKYEK